MEYVILNPSSQRSLLQCVKGKMSCTWKALAQKLGIHRSTLFFYLRCETHMPILTYQKLANIARWKEKIRTLSMQNQPTKPIFSGKLNAKLAEFIGILAGDGHLGLRGEIDISGDKDLDSHYFHEYLPALYKQLFNLCPYHVIQQNCIHCRSNSRILVRKLHARFEIPIGQKLHNLKIPCEIKQQASFLKAYLRGLFDTDGCVYQHHKNLAALEYSSGDPSFLKEISAALSSLNFHPSMGQDAVRIYKKKEIVKFFKVIKPANKKHTFKFEAFSRTGSVPSKKELLKNRR